MANYWQDRAAKSLQNITEKSQKQIEKQLARYYAAAMRHSIEEFENTYNKLLATMEEGREVTPADLYNLDKYWQLQGQLRRELMKLGDKQHEAMSRAFEMDFFEVYYSIAVQGEEAYSTIDAAGARQLIESIWAADGKSYSQRIWDNIELLMQTLNDELLECVITGKTTRELKQKLQARFGVSYRRADMLARTELAHIQTEAAKKRYEDYGIQKVQFWADEDERRCPECGKMHEKIFLTTEAVPLPLHPNCRCCLIPYIEKDNKKIGQN